MNPIKKFYNFFRSVKDTNSAMSENKVTEKGWNIKKKSERADSKNPTETEKQQQNEVTAKCLKEFDNILQEINRDVLKEPVTLDEIEDVLNNITEEHNLKESEFLNLEIPRFDLQDLLQGFDSFNENHIEEVDENNLEKIHEPIDLDESNEIKLYYLDKNNKPTEITDFFIKIREDDVISINSDDSQAHEVNIEENYEPKNVNDVNKRINDEPKNVTKIECINDEPRNVIENEGINAIESKNVTEHGRTNDEPRNTQDANNGINEIKNVKDEEITSKSQDVFEDDSDDDCGYQSSDFEFITEDEAKLDGLIINFHPNMLSVSQPKRVNTFEVAIDQFSEQRNIPSRNSIRPRLNNVQKNSPELKSLGPGPSNMQGNYTEINNLHSGPKVNNIGSSLRYVRKIRPGLNKFDSDPTNLQIYSPGGSGPSCIRLHSQNSTTCGPDNKQRGDPDHSTMKAIIVDDRNGTRPKIKISYHELNNMQHGPESNNLDCSSNLREGKYCMSLLIDSRTHILRYLCFIIKI